MGFGDKSKSKQASVIPNVIQQLDLVKKAHPFQTAYSMGQGVAVRQIDSAFQTNSVPSPPVLINYMENSAKIEEADDDIKFANQKIIEQERIIDECNRELSKNQSDDNHKMLLSKRAEAEKRVFKLKKSSVMAAELRKEINVTSMELLTPYQGPVVDSKGSKTYAGIDDMTQAMANRLSSFYAGLLACLDDEDAFVNLKEGWSAYEGNTNLDDLLGEKNPQEHFSDYLSMQFNENRNTIRDINDLLGTTAASASSFSKNDSDDSNVLADSIWGALKKGVEEKKITEENNPESYALYQSIVEKLKQAEKADNSLMAHDEIEAKIRRSMIKAASIDHLNALSVHIWNALKAGVESGSITKEKNPASFELYQDIDTQLKHQDEYDQVVKKKITETNGEDIEFILGLSGQVESKSNPFNLEDEDKRTELRMAISNHERERRKKDLNALDNDRSIPKNSEHYAERKKQIENRYNDVISNIFKKADDFKDKDRFLTLCNHYSSIITNHKKIASNHATSELKKMKAAIPLQMIKAKCTNNLQGRIVDIMQVDMRNKLLNELKGKLMVYADKLETIAKNQDLEQLRNFKDMYDIIVNDLYNNGLFPRGYLDFENEQNISEDNPLHLQPHEFNEVRIKFKNACRIYQDNLVNDLAKVNFDDINSIGTFMGKVGVAQSAHILYDEQKLKALIIKTIINHPKFVEIMKILDTVFSPLLNDGHNFLHENSMTHAVYEAIKQQFRLLYGEMYQFNLKPNQPEPGELNKTLIEQLKSNSPMLHNTLLNNIVSSDNLNKIAHLSLTFDTTTDNTQQDFVYQQLNQILTHFPLITITINGFTPQSSKAKTLKYGMKTAPEDEFINLNARNNAVVNLISTIPANVDDPSFSLHNYMKNCQDMAIIKKIDNNGPLLSLIKNRFAENQMNRYFGTDKYSKDNQNKNALHAMSFFARYTNDQIYECISSFRDSNPIAAFNLYKSMAHFYETLKEPDYAQAMKYLKLMFKIEVPNNQKQTDELRIQTHDLLVSLSVKWVNHALSTQSTQTPEAITQLSTLIERLFEKKYENSALLSGTVLPSLMALRAYPDNALIDTFNQKMKTIIIDHSKVNSDIITGITPYLQPPLQDHQLDFSKTLLEDETTNLMEWMGNDPKAVFAFFEALDVPFLKTLNKKLFIQYKNALLSVKADSTELKEAMLPLLMKLYHASETDENKVTVLHQPMMAFFSEQPLLAQYTEEQIDAFNDIYSSMLSTQILALSESLTPDSIEPYIKQAKLFIQQLYENKQYQLALDVCTNLVITLSFNAPSVLTDPAYAAVMRRISKLIDALAKQDLTQDEAIKLRAKHENLQMDALKLAQNKIHRATDVVSSAVDSLHKALSRHTRTRSKTDSDDDPIDFDDDAEHLSATSSAGSDRPKDAQYREISDNVERDDGGFVDVQAPSSINFNVVTFITHIKTTTNTEINRHSNDADHQARYNADLRALKSALLHGNKKQKTVSFHKQPLPDRNHEGESADILHAVAIAQSAMGQVQVAGFLGYLTRSDKMPGYLSAYADAVKENDTEAQDRLKRHWKENQAKAAHLLQLLKELKKVKDRPEDSHHVDFAPFKTFLANWKKEDLSVHPNERRASSSSSSTKAGMLFSSVAQGFIKAGTAIKDTVAETESSARKNLLAESGDELIAWALDDKNKHFIDDMIAALEPVAAPKNSLGVVYDTSHGTANKAAESKLGNFLLNIANVDAPPVESAALKKVDEVYQASTKAISASLSLKSDSPREHSNLRASPETTDRLAQIHKEAEERKAAEKAERKESNSNNNNNNNNNNRF